MPALGDARDAVRERVASASRELARRGLVLGTAGNVSARVGDAIALTPTGAQLATLEAADITLIDLDGTRLTGEPAPSSEVGLHLGIYQRFDAGAVVHTHSPMATAAACVLVDELPLVHYTMLSFGGAVRIAPYRTFGTVELAEVTLEALDGRTAALMANHGAVVYAPDVEAAVQDAQLLEWSAAVYWHATALGTPRTLDGAQSQAVLAAVIERGYGERRRRRACGS